MRWVKLSARLAAAIYTDNYAAASAALPKVISTFQDFIALPALPGDRSKELDRLRQDLLDVTQHYNSFNAFVSETKDSFFFAEYTNLAATLKARSALRSRLAAESFLLSDLTKAAVISYLEDPARDKSTLASNLNGIATYIAQFPAKEPFINLRSIDWTCSGTGSCMPVEADTHWRILYAQVPIGASTRKLPLYVLAPNPQRFMEPLFRLPVTSVSIVDTSPPKNLQ